MKPDLRYILQDRILIADGAMGTYLYQMGLPIGISYEELNLVQPQTIAEVHRQYYAAGARLIETNTFSANRVKLSKFGLETEMEQINRAGVALARQAVGQDAYIVGAIGSIRAGKRNNVRTVDVKKAFREQIHVLIDENVDGLMLETFYDLNELLLAVTLVRELSSTIPLICQFATEGTGTTQDGFELLDAFEQLKDHGADVVGFNCRVGPNGIMRTVESLAKAQVLPLSVFPNAGLPDYVDGTYTYTATPAYFAQSALRFAALGARIIGGCCGTTPEHIAAVAQAISSDVPVSVSVESNAEGGSSRSKRTERIDVREQVQQLASASAARPTLLDIVKERHTVIVELDPPRDLDIEKFMLGAQALHEQRVDAITMADNSLAVTRMSNLALGSLLQEKLDVRPLVHIACRDRNMIGTQSHLMGLHALGIDHVLAVTGDPAKFGDLPGSSSVYDLTSFEIIRMIKQLNEGIAFSGKPLKKKANFVVGAAFNPNVKYLDKAIQRLERKIEAGADYIMTQPIYDPQLIVHMYEATRHIQVPIFVGVMPLASGRNAEYLHNEVPGIQLSDSVRQRMKDLDGPAGRKMGIEIAKELLDVIMPYYHGIYIMTPFLLYELSVELTQYVWKKSNR